MGNQVIAIAALAAVLAAGPQPSRALRPSAAGEPYGQEIAAWYGTAEGLPSEDVLAIEIDGAGTVWAGTALGLARFTAPAPGKDEMLARLVAPGPRRGRDFAPVAGFDGQRVTALAAAGEALLVAAGSSIWRLPPGGASPERLATLGAAVIFDLAVRGDAVPVEIFAATRDGVYLLRGDASRPRLALELELGARRVAVAPRGCPVAIAAEAGLLVADCGANGDASTWTRLLSRAGRRSWAPVEVGAVAFAGDGTLWLGSPQGLVRRDPAGATVLYDGGDGLPWTDFTAAAPAPDGGVWLGTRLGAIHRFAEAGAGDRVSGTWEYRQGRRWLPHDDVRDVVVDGSGAAWMATAGGVARIVRVPMTLAEKARFFEAEIDRFHRRTPYGYVDAVRLGAPGDRARFEQRSSDNDGLWTGMYGAAECFAYAATRRPEARARADAAFRALAFLSEVTQGGSHPAPPGFVARSILPTSGPDPNAGRLEEDRRRRREEDALWKVITPRWPTDASGQWYWKTDASSDELDGHFFLYALYHDLVAETEAERAEVRAVVTGIVDHLLEHDYALHDHDGEPTRWAVFGPAQLNHDPMWWGERGLNSLSILSYLRVAAHVSRAAGGSERYDRAARELIERHGYAANVRVPKIHTGPGTGNQSDDEMAFMSFWNLLRYERDPELRALWGHAFHRYWLMERPERNPLFAFLYAASVRGLAWRGAFDTTAFGLDSDDEALEDAIDTLERYPLDRVDWALRNSHRHDVVLLATDPDDGRGGARGRRHDGKVLPIDERFVDHWNHDPWRLDHGGEGRKLGDGASFLLPYYLGLYEGFLSE